MILEIITIGVSLLTLLVASGFNIVEIVIEQNKKGKREEAMENIININNNINRMTPQNSDIVD